MNVHKCSRCDGSGNVAGGFGWEIPWTQAVQLVVQPQECPDCGGAGALLEFGDLAPARWPVGRHAKPSYADRVAMILEIQRHRQRQAN